MKIAVFNVQSGMATTLGYFHYLLDIWKFYLPHTSRVFKRIARFIDEEEVDIIAFTEIDNGSIRTFNRDQNLIIQKNSRLKYHHFFQTFKVRKRISQGNAIHSIYPLKAIHNHILPGTGESRYLSHAQINYKHKKIDFFITHLSLQFDIRKRQIQKVAEHINKTEGPLILAGDFNISKRSELAIIEKTRLQKVSSANTYPSWRPKRCLDYIFLTEEFRITNSYTYSKKRFSDHLPLIVDIEF